MIRRIFGFGTKVYASPDNASTVASTARSDLDADAQYGYNRTRPTSDAVGAVGAVVPNAMAIAHVEALRLSNHRRGRILECNADPFPVLRKVPVSVQVHARSSPQVHAVAAADLANPTNPTNLTNPTNPILLQVSYNFSEGNG
jgi:hypothetical protein